VGSKADNHTLWEQRLREWEESKQSAVSWCQKHSIPYGTFCYWKSKLQSKEQEESIFEELQESSPSAIELRWGEASLRLSKDFDMETLEKCLIALRRSGCSQ